MTMRAMVLVLCCSASALASAQTVPVDTLKRTVTTADTLIHLVPSPTRTIHDTVTVAVHDTVVKLVPGPSVTVHDTVYAVLPSSMPVPLTDLVQLVAMPDGATLAYSGTAFLGRVVQQSTSGLPRWQAYQFQPPSIVMPCVAVAGVCTTFPSALAAGVAMRHP